ncbi:MAG TPA: HemK/PrmC family methyltransferase [Phycisphaerae bacterium]|nr:HemK/PrmC family methyltransferase [Phycisphaerae bacterium]HPS52336.1 HemK/PrmC family methyltransferase [Phycisphaerae bacterium]
MNESWTTGRLLSWTKEYFEHSGLENPRLCAEVLLSHCVGCSRIELYARFNSEPTDRQRSQFRELVRRAAMHEPVAYLVGSREFYSLNFRVTPAVLIPRPETEMLVEKAVEHLQKLAGVHVTQQKFDSQESSPVDLDEIEKLASAQPEESQSSEPAFQPKKNRSQYVGNVWDVCTGSGCVACAIAANAPGVNVLASDISPAAIAVAVENASRLNLSQNVTFEQADLLELPVGSRYNDEYFDVITANPPYVAENDPVGDSTKYEPRDALYAGIDGLDVLRRLIPAVPKRLGRGGIFCVEFGYTHADAVRNLIVQTGEFAEPEIFKDFQGIERVAVAKRV